MYVECATVVGLWFSVLTPKARDRRVLLNGLVFGGVLIPCCVCSGDSGGSWRENVEKDDGSCMCGSALLCSFSPPLAFHRA